MLPVSVIIFEEEIWTAQGVWGRKFPREVQRRSPDSEVPQQLKL